MRLARHRGDAARTAELQACRARRGARPIDAELTSGASLEAAAAMTRIARRVDAVPAAELVVSVAPAVARADAGHAELVGGAAVAARAAIDLRSLEIVAGARRAQAEPCEASARASSILAGLTFWAGGAARSTIFAVPVGVLGLHTAIGIRAVHRGDEVVDVRTAAEDAGLTELTDVAAFPAVVKLAAQIDASGAAQAV